MAERKVLIKYFPKNFNHDLIQKRGRGKDKLMMVRNMLPMSLRCNTCQNYLYIGTKFNMRMEICNEQCYLGIKVFRFYFKCTYCYAEISFKTDPKNHDYLVQAGGIRNYEAIKDAQQAEKVLKRIKGNQKQQDSMKYLENRSYDSKRQMELMEALEDIKNMNRRQAVIDPEDLLQNLIYEEEQQDLMDEAQELQITKKFNELRGKLKEELEGTVKKQEIEEAQQNLDLKQGSQEKSLIKQSLKQQRTTDSFKKFKGSSIIANMKKKILKPANKQEIKSTSD